MRNIGILAMVIPLLAVCVCLGCASQPRGVRWCGTVPVLHWVDGPVGRIRVDDGGQEGGGVPVVLVHGLAGDRQVWQSQLEKLRRARRAVALELRGHGESAAPADGACSVPTWADDVASVVDALGLRHFVLVGHSLGGNVIAAYAGQHPERVAGLVFADATGDASQESPAEAKAFVAGLENGDLRSNERSFLSALLEPATATTRAQVLAAFDRFSPELFLCGVKSLYAYSPVEDLARFAGPMLTVESATKDAPTAMHSVAPMAKGAVIEGASHWLMLDKPAELAGHIEAFLATLDAAAPRDAP
ncbi:MAG: alpha/beta hydrolase [Pseudomonadota bacterium]